MIRLQGALLLSVLVVGCKDERQPSAPQAAEPRVSQPASEAPVVAEVEGKRVEGFAASYSRGILTLYTGEDPQNGDGERIRFWGLPDKPKSQRVSYPAREGAITGGQLTYSKKDPTVEVALQWLKDWRYELKLGEERDYKVPVTIISAEGSDPAVEVHGTIVARTAGIEMKDGVIDRGFDHVDTIQWITREWIREHRSVKSLAELPDTYIVQFGQKRARCSYRYVDEGGSIAIAKLLLEKQDGRWTVVRELEPSQLMLAHPLEPPSDSVLDALRTVAALRFEQEIYQPAGGHMRLEEPAFFPCGGGQVAEQPGYCEVMFARSKQDRDLEQHDPTGCHYVTYLLAKDDEGVWQITKTLGSTERYDPFTKKVEPRKLPESCATQ